MAGITTLEQNIARLEKATADAREATREAHEAVKDLREERKQVDYLLGHRAVDLVDERIGKLVKDQLDQLGPGLAAHSQQIYQRVTEQADKLVNICLGPEWSTRNGKEDLRPALAAKLREWLREEMGR